MWRDRYANSSEEKCHANSATTDVDKAARLLVGQALANIVTVMAEAGGRPEDIARLTWYVVDKAEYLASSRPLGRAYREVLGGHYPAMTAVQVAALVEDGAKVEIEATAVIPARS